MVLVALGLRLAVMGFLYGEQLETKRDHWPFGYEVGRIARSIALGKGYGNPLFEDTGPTAWMPPVYPYILAGVFKTFGVYTVASAFAILSLQALMSALTCLPIYFIALRSFGERAALSAGWLWAFFPYGIYFPVERIWPTWLATLLLAILFLMTLRLEDTSSAWDWAAFGLLWGVTALTEPSVISVLLPLATWAGYRLYTQRCRSVSHVAARMAVAAVAFIVTVSPWFIRNYRTFHQFIPFRDNLGLELRVGNNGDNSTWANYDIGPWHSDVEWEQFKQIGEVKYMAEKKQQALEFMSGHPGYVAWSTVRRIGYVWTGFWSLDRRYLADEPLDPPNILLCTALTIFALIGLRRAFRTNAVQAMPYALVLLFFPVVYYITHPEVYYRRPIDPFLLVLAVYAVTPRHEPSQGQPLDDEEVVPESLFIADVIND